MERHPHRRGIENAIILIAVLFGTKTGFADILRCEGYVTFQSYNIAGITNSSLEFNYSVVIATNGWRIEAAEPGGFRHVSSRSNNISAHFFSSAESKAMPVEVRDTDFPVSNYYVQIPWFAFIGKELSLDTKHLRPAPWWPPKDFAQAHTFRWKATKSAYEQVEEVEFIFDNELVDMARKSTLLVTETKSVDWHEKLQRFRAKHPTNALAARFDVLDWTNSMGIHLPSRYELISYFPVFEGKTNIDARFTGVLTSVRRQPEAELFCDASEYGTIDFRFNDPKRGINYISYVTNTVVTSTGDERLIGIFNNKRDTFPLLKPIWMRDIWKVIIFLGALFMPVVYWKRRGRSERGKQ